MNINRLFARILIVFLFLLPISKPLAENSNTSLGSLSKYLDAYKDTLQAIEGNDLIWKDGTRMPISTVKSNLQNEKALMEALNSPDLRLQLLLPYPKGHSPLPPPVGSDPGRIRYLPFFQKMYGSSEEEVKKNLVEIDWLPQTFTGDNAIKLMVTKVNGVAEKMQKISDELDKLVQKKPEYKKYLANPGGTFDYRFIAGTDRLSAHSFGMTIDINADLSDYWLWDYKKKKGLDLDAVVLENDLTSKDVPPYQNSIPWEIVDIFEKYHFIWGGKWFHYDTMHFEYRPELF